ncbi:hypothetical protein M758_9G148900 [Ceratodon purpureus]|nr:hypothetical protein M758_9G148900 [Ceratodon purpureus]
MKSSIHSSLHSQKGNSKHFSALLRNASNFLSKFNRDNYSWRLDRVTIDGVRKLDRMLLRVEKNEPLRTSLSGFMEGLIRSALRMVRLSLAPFSTLSFIDFDTFMEAREAVHNQVHSLESIIALFSGVAPASGLDFAYNALVSAVVLSNVLQYLIGYVDKGGTKTYNSGSLEFRATFVSLLLFRGAYVWIKFRDVAPKRAVYRRSRKDGNGGFHYYGKYEPRFKPPREKDAVTGRALKFDYIPLGGYDTQLDAEVACQIAGFYYGKDEGRVDLEDGSYFYIPGMSEQERSLCGEQKRNWVRGKVKEVFKDFKQENAARRRSALDPNAGDSYYSEDQAFTGSTETVNSEEEFLNFLFQLSESHCFDAEIDLNLDDVPGFCDEGDQGFSTMQECLNERLSLQKEQLEAEFSLQIAEHQHKHLQIQNRLKEENLKLQQENEHLKRILHQVLKPLSPT